MSANDTALAGAPPDSSSWMEAGRAIGQRIIARRSSWMFGLARWFACRSISGHFNAVLVSRKSKPPKYPEEPVLLVCNHPSWWDWFIFPVVSLMFPEREYYGAVGERGPARFRLLERFGLFPVHHGSVQTSGNFLGTALAILERPGATLLMAPQGRYTEPRQRPAGFRSGVGLLAQHMRRGYILPLAIECAFGKERKPDVLCRFGELIAVADSPPRTSKEWTAFLERKLEAAQDALARDAVFRNREPFEVVLRGRLGVTGQISRTVQKLLFLSQARKLSAK